MALVTRVAMGTQNNRRFINMATVPVRTAKTFRKFIVFIFFGSLNFLLSNLVVFGFVC